MAPTIKEVCEEVLRRVTPTGKQRESILKLAGELRGRVRRVAKEMKVRAEVRIEGSVAKDTWLSEEPDIDIFMRAPPSTPKEAFGTVYLQVAKRATEGAKQIERFAEHPYLEVTVDSVRVNIVPCYKVEPREWISATDRTPYHTDYVKARLTETLRGEVRLLKRFMKGIGVYGAEIRVGGFSGYLCELLILSHGSFLKVLEAFANWRKGEVIDHEGYYKGREDEVRLLFREPLVIVDPVDMGRNAASAVREEQLDHFITASRAFLRSPNLSFFYPPETEPYGAGRLVKTMRARGSTMIFLKFGRVEAVPDVLWGQLYKSQRSLRGMLKRSGFQVLRDGVWSDEKNAGVFVFEVEKRRLTPVKKHLGPPIEKRVECERFLKKHLNSPRTLSGPYVENGRWVVETLRENVDVVDLLHEKLKDGGRRAGVAELVSRTLRGTLQILVNEEILGFYSSNSGFAKFLIDYLDGRPKWLRRGI